MLDEFHKVKSPKDIKRLKVLGQHLRLIRESQGISQAQLAFESKLTVLQIGRIERGEINCGVISLFKIADALSVPPRELFNFKLPYQS
jgi:transcriptional regulator with XRE-family HTH domain